MKSIEIIQPEYFIDEIYTHLDKVCKQNKKTLAPRDNETIEKITRVLINSLEDLNEEVLNRTRSNIYKEWNKDQKGFLYIHKGFHIAFKFALEQSIPRTLEQVWQETPELNKYHFELLNKTNKQHYRVYKEDMLFQKGTAEYLHNYARYIPEEEYLFRSNSALQRSHKIGIPELERWNFITASLWEYINSNKIDVSKKKYEKLNHRPFDRNTEFKMGIMEAIDYYSEK